MYDTVWKAAVSFLLRPESVTVKVELRELGEQLTGREQACARGRHDTAC